MASGEENPLQDAFAASCKGAKDHPDMKASPVMPDALRGLPSAITMSADPMAVYYGTPIEMVKQMAAEMGPNVGVRRAISTILTALYRNRGVLIVIPEDAPEEVVAAIFVYALLDSGVSKPVTAST